MYLKQILIFLAIFTLNGCVESNPVGDGQQDPVSIIGKWYLIKEVEEDESKNFDLSTTTYTFEVLNDSICISYFHNTVDSVTYSDTNNYSINSNEITTNYVSSALAYTSDGTSLKVVISDSLGVIVEEYHYEKLESQSLPLSTWSEINNKNLNFLAAFLPRQSVTVIIGPGN